MPIWFLDSSVFIVERCTDTATLRQFQDRTPLVRFRPLSGFIFFPTGWKCQPEGEDIGSGCCGGGVIQLRSRERALLRQGQLFEPAASSGPAAMVLAISRNLSCIPRRSPCPGRYPLPLAPGFLPVSRSPARIDATSLWRPVSYPGRYLLPLTYIPAQKKRTPPPRRPGNSPLISPRNLPEQLNITSLNLNIRSQFLPLRTNIRHLKNTPLTNPTL